MRDKSITNACQYIGFDFNPIWDSVQVILKNIFLSNNCNILLSFQNESLLPDNPVLQNTKLLILNHVVSDVYKHVQNHRADTLTFLKNDICPIIQQMPVDSYILINDVNSYKMGRYEIETWADSMQNTCIIELGYFEHLEYPQSKFNNPHTQKRIDRDSVFLDSGLVCQSAYVILKKKDI
jgi:hypothetical protein